MNNVQESLRIEVECIEGCEIGLTASSSRHNECTACTYCSIAVQLFQSLTLHKIGLYIACGKVIVHVPTLNRKVELIGIQIDNFTVQKMRCRPFVIELCVCLTIYFGLAFANNHIPLDIFEQRVTSDIGRTDNYLIAIVELEKVSL